MRHRGLSSSSAAACCAPPIQNGSTKVEPYRSGNPPPAGKHIGLVSGKTDVPDTIVRRNAARSTFDVECSMFDVPFHCLNHNSTSLCQGPIP